ncbi:MAG: ferritin [Fusobacteriota bacterium]
MLTKRLQDAINDQINEEMFSAYLYQSMSAFCEIKNLDGFANWTSVQAKEEMTHAMKLYNFILEKGGEVELQAIKSPQSKWDSIEKMAQDILDHEEHITKCIDDLLDVAREEKDNATQNMLQWFVDEQVEEEANADEILQKVKMVGEKGPGLFMLDNELKQRIFVDETKEEQ